MTTAIIGLNMLTGVTIAPVGAHIIRALRPRPSNWALAWVRNLAYTQHLRQRLYRRGRQNHVQLRNEDRPLPEVGFWFHRSLDDRVRVGVLVISRHEGSGLSGEELRIDPASRHGLLGKVVPPVSEIRSDAGADQPHPITNGQTMLAGLSSDTYSATCLTRRRHKRRYSGALQKCPRRRFSAGIGLL